MMSFFVPLVKCSFERRNSIYGSTHVLIYSCSINDYTAHIQKFGYQEF